MINNNENDMINESEDDLIYIYIAGPMFKEAEINQRRLEAKKLDDVLQDSNRGYYICNPVDLPFDEFNGLSSRVIFSTDYYNINDANVFFFELASEDSGTMVEFGNVIEKYMQGNPMHIYPVFYDLRLSRNDVAGIECPIGFNSYLVGALDYNRINTYSSFDEALLQFKKDFNLGD